MREEKNISQRELGRRLGRHSNFVSSCEMGDRALLYTEVRQWYAALEVSWVSFTQHLDELLAAQDTAEGTTDEAKAIEGTSAANELADASE